MKKSKLFRVMMALCVVSLFIANTSFADEGVAKAADTDNLMKMVQNLQAQLSKVQEDYAATQQEVNSLRGQLAAKPEVKVEVPKEVENQIKGLQRDIDALRAQKTAPVTKASIPSASVPAWLDGTHFGGDILVRMQMESNSGEQQDRVRGRVRLRYGISKQLNDELKAGFRLATGAGNRRSPINTMGNTASGFDQYEAWIDQAYVEYKPNFLNTLNDDLSIVLHGGKFKENWKHKGILIHPEAVGFDGFGQSMVYDLNDSVTVDFNMAQLFISENIFDTSGAAGAKTSVDGDSELYVFDLGLKGTAEAFNWGLRGTSYLFAGYNDSFNGTSMALGGGGDYRPVVLTADLGFDMADMPVKTFAQFGKNLNDEAAGATSPDADLYWSMGIEFNKMQAPGDWSAGYKFAYLEENFMPVGLPDADLVNGNTADSFGGSAHWFYANYRLFASTDLNLTMILPRTLSSAGVDASDGETDSLIAKLNFTTRF
jgi:hypothetical protein